MATGWFWTKVYAHFETMRLYTVIWSGLVSLAGGCIAYGDIPPLMIAALIFVIPMMGWTAGLYLSDYLDRKLDEIEKPHRPIPSGRIRPGEALVMGGVFAVAGLILSVFLNVDNVIFVFIVAFLVLVYARFTKSRGVWGNVTRGLVTVVAFLFGVIGVGVSLDAVPVSLLLFSVVFLLHDTASNLIGTIRDVEGDRRGGYQTVPVRWGVGIALSLALFLSISYVVIVSWFVWVEEVLRFPDRFLVLFVVVVGILVVLFGMMLRAVQRMNRQLGLRAHELFVAERITLAGGLIFGMASEMMVAVILYVITIAITLVSQFFFRSKYEFVT